MLTATIISEMIGLDINTVRYRLTVLRRNKDIKAERIGQTWVYPVKVLNKIKDFDLKYIDITRTVKGKK